MDLEEAGPSRLALPRGGQIFKGRYMALGFNNKSNLDEGAMWRIDFALMGLTAAGGARIAALVKKAVG